MYLFTVYTYSKYLAHLAVQSVHGRLVVGVCCHPLPVLGPHKVVVGPIDAHHRTSPHVSIAQAAARRGFIALVAARPAAVADAIEVALVLARMVVALLARQILARQLVHQEVALAAGTRLGQTALHLDVLAVLQLQTKFGIAC